MNGKYRILIDTNAMVYLCLYIEMCESARKEVGVSVDGIYNVLNCKGVRKYCLEKKDLKKGYKLFAYLKQKNNEFNGNVDILFSLLSKMELFHLFLEYAFDEKLTKMHIPYLARRKRFLRNQVDFSYEDAVLKRWNMLKEKTNEAEIGFLCPEREEKEILLDIEMINQIVSKYIVLEPIDLYLYVLGIKLMVDEIYTIDEEFRTTICNVKSHWKDIREKMTNDLKELLPFRDMYEKEGEIRLPDGING